MDDEMCSVCWGEYTLKYELSCKHKFCYLCLKQAAVSANMKCPYCQADIPESVLEEAQISEEDYKNVATHKWMYSGRNDGWWYYDPNSSKIIEEAYSKYTDVKEVDSADEVNTSIELNILGRTYTINFERMEQTHGINTRKIKRVGNGINIPSTIKGIAGLAVSAKIKELPPPSYTESYVFNPNAWIEDEY